MSREEGNVSGNDFKSLSKLSEKQGESKESSHLLKPGKKSDHHKKSKETSEKNKRKSRGSTSRKEAHPNEDEMSAARSFADNLIESTTKEAFNFIMNLPVNERVRSDCQGDSKAEIKESIEDMNDEYEYKL